MLHSLAAEHRAADEGGDRTMTGNTTRRAVPGAIPVIAAVPDAPSICLGPSTT